MKSLSVVGFFLVLASFSDARITIRKANDLDDPVLTAPADGAHFKVNENITFTWNAVKGAKKYDWAIGMTGGREVSSTTNGLKFDFFFGDDNIGRRSWKVKATNGDDESDYTESYLYVDEPKSHPVRRFKTNDLDDPVLIAPEDGAHFKAGQNITFSWKPVKGAKEYELNLGLSGGRTVIFGPWDGTEVTWDSTGAHSTGRSGWKVKAINGDDESDFTESYIYIDNVLEAPALQQPKEGDHFKKSDNITFTWSKVTGAKLYAYQCQLSGGRVVTITTDETTVYRDWHESDTGKYWWQVKGIKTEDEEESDFAQANINIDN